jgi:branched-subunit amino acid ABC-type transport system permease component
VDTDVTLDMGMNPLMAAVVAVVIAGEGRSIGGLALVALGIGLLQQFGVLWIGAAWQNTVVFALLLVFLFIRPKHFQNLSKREFNMGT